MGILDRDVVRPGTAGMGIPAAVRAMSHVAGPRDRTRMQPWSLEAVYGGVKAAGPGPARVSRTGPERVAGAPPHPPCTGPGPRAPRRFASAEPAAILRGMTGGDRSASEGAGSGGRARPEHVFRMEALEDPGPSGATVSEQVTEVGLRPATLAEFVGQPAVVDNLRIHVGAARERQEPPDHVLFSGPPGLGKTSLARIVASELGSRLHSTSGPSLDKPKDLTGVLTNLEAGDVLFIDEIHRIPVSVEEFLYTAMEDFRVEMTLETGPHARILPVPLQPFTLVGATTREGLLSAPFRARFGLSLRLDPYPVEDLERIVRRAAGILGVEVTDDAARMVAERSRGTPRIAGRFLKRARDHMQVARSSQIDAALTRTALESLGVDDHGLEEMDRRILRCLASHAPQPAALKTIAAVVGETEDTIEDVFEPHLLRCGFVRKTPRGRLVTAAGLELLGIDPPSMTSNQESAQGGLPFDA